MNDAIQITVFLFPAVVFVMWFFYKKDMESRDERITADEKRFEKYVESADDRERQLTKIVHELTVLVQRHDKDLDLLGSTMRDIGENAMLAFTSNNNLSGRVDELERKNNKHE